MSDDVTIMKETGQMVKQMYGIIEPKLTGIPKFPLFYVKFLTKSYNNNINNKKERN